MTAILIHPLHNRMDYIIEVQPLLEQIEYMGMTNITIIHRLYLIHHREYTREVTAIVRFYVVHTLTTTVRFIRGGDLVAVDKSFLLFQAGNLSSVVLWLVLVPTY